MKVYYILSLLLVWTFACQSESTSAVAESSEEDVTVSHLATSSEVVETSISKESEGETEINIKDDQSSESSIQAIEPAKPQVASANAIAKSQAPGTISRTENVTEERKESAVMSKPIEPESAIEEVPLTSPPSHSAWDALLQANVSATGQVNYRALKAKQGELDKYLALLAAQSPQQDWSAAEVKAYWINAYNAFTVKLILKNYPLKSIRNIDGGNPWDTKWIELGDKTYSLNDIEHRILRPRFKDARIHFAVNCAAASCPPLHNRAFTASNTTRFLEKLTNRFINNSSYNTITDEQARVSKIFEWYAEDFGELRAYLNRYSELEIAPDRTIEFEEYDWSLNGI